MAFCLKHYLKKAKLGMLWNMTSHFSVQSPAAIKVDKTLLTKLRKKTGFSYFKCNNALKSANNNPEEAEEWLYQQAEKEGWEKASKLKSRTTNQGLIGVLSEGNYASLVQIACETDFVARNQLFQELVHITAQATINFRRNVILQNLKVNSFEDDNITHLREFLLGHEMQTLPLPNENLTIEEHVVGLVGKIGENIKLKRALAIATSKDNIIGISSHGNISTTVNGCVMGTYGAAVVLKPVKEIVDKTNITNLARSISQHVIGMNPKSLSPTSDVPEEEALLSQGFLLDEKKSIRDLVAKEGVEIVDFIRYSIDD